MHRLLWLSFVVVGILVIGILFVDTVPPNAHTHATMTVMKRRILRFAHAQGALPKTVEGFPPMEGFGNEVVDGWGRPIAMIVAGDQVTLRSFGRDGLPGGTGDDTDMIAVFAAKTPTGAWSAELTDWLINPYGRQGD